MKYLTVQQVGFSGISDGFDGRVRTLVEALADLEAADPAITDLDVAATLDECRIDVQMTAEASGPAEAMTKAQSTLRAAIHAIGDATPGWETGAAVGHVAPYESADLLAWT